MKRKNKYILIATFLIVAMILLEVLSRPSKQIHEILNALPQTEQNDLEQFCRYVLQKTEFGYTIFGDKPMTYLYLDSLREVDCERSILNHGLPILKKVLQQISLENFIFAESTKNNLQIVYLVNKKAAKNTILKNKSAFVQCASLDHSEQLLATVLNEHYVSELFHKDNSYLLGILSGHGNQNAFHYFRRELLKQHLAKINDSPFSLDFHSILDFIDEVGLLNRKLYPTNEYFPGNDSQVQLPQFACDPESQETKDLIEKYRRQQQILQRVLSEDHVTTRFLQKLTE